MLSFRMDPHPTFFSPDRSCSCDSPCDVCNEEQSRRSEVKLLAARRKTFKSASERSIPGFALWSFCTGKGLDLHFFAALILLFSMLRHWLPLGQTVRFQHQYRSCWLLFQLWLWFCSIFKVLALVSVVALILQHFQSWRKLSRLFLYWWDTLNYGNHLVNFVCNLRDCCHLNCTCFTDSHCTASDFDTAADCSLAETKSLQRS